jgi:hypothetical protein
MKQTPRQRKALLDYVQSNRTPPGFLDLGLTVTHLLWRTRLIWIALGISTVVVGAYYVLEFLARPVG